ncbi:MAG TPA: hypothetical protein VF700_00550 [Segetibacter sp.]
MNRYLEFLKNTIKNSHIKSPMSLPLGIITPVDFKIKIVQVQRDLQYKPPAFITS